MTQRPLKPPKWQKEPNKPLVADPRFLFEWGKKWKNVFIMTFSDTLHLFFFFLKQLVTKLPLS